MNKLLYFLILLALVNGCNQVPDSPTFINPLDLKGDFDDIPPFSQFTTSVDSGIANETEFIFDASSSIEEDVPKTDLIYQWDFDNDGIWDTDWLHDPLIKRILSSGKKNREIALLVQGGKKLQSKIAKTVFVNTRPDADFHWYLGPIDGNYYFDASNSFDYEDNKNLSFRWDFNGDGTWDTKWSNSPKHYLNLNIVQIQRITLNVKDTDSLENTCSTDIITGLNTMVNIEAGNFIMGSDNDIDDVKPAHNIYLDEFFIDRCEVSNGQYAIFLNTLFKNNDIQVFSDHVRQGRYEMLHLNESQKIFFENDSFRVIDHLERLPVEQVTWYGAKIYAEFYNKRLPSEAEWEKAARGTDARLFPWGSNTPNELLANVNMFFNSTTPIGSFYPSGSSIYGCLDMTGNVWEWCSDWYDNDYYNISPVDNPQGGEGVYKVLRGADWGSAIFNCYTYRRSSHHPVQSTFYQIGFRCVK